MADLAALLGAVAALLWPIFAFVVLFLFRRQVEELLGRLRRGVFFGQEIELHESLERLNRSAAEAASEVPTLSQIESEQSESDARADEDAVRSILDEAAKSPKVALLRLASEIEREINELLAATGWAHGRRRVPFQEAIKILQESGVVLGHVPSSAQLFWDVRNRLVHGGRATQDDVLSAVDSGITILRAIQAIPREKNIVYHPGTEVYADPEGRQVCQDVKAVVLETESPGGATKTLRVYPSTRTHFRKGMQVAWEWDLNRVFGESWYRDPDTEEIRYGWTSAGEFIERNIQEFPDKDSLPK